MISRSFIISHFPGTYPVCISAVAIVPCPFLKAYDSVCDPTPQYISIITIFLDAFLSIGYTDVSGFCISAGNFSPSSDRSFSRSFFLPFFALIVCKYFLLPFMYLSGRSLFFMGLSFGIYLLESGVF